MVLPGWQRLCSARCSAPRSATLSAAHAAQSTPVALGGRARESSVRSVRVPRAAAVSRVRSARESAAGVGGLICSSRVAARHATRRRSSAGSVAASRSGRAGWTARVLRGGADDSSAAACSSARTHASRLRAGRWTSASCVSHSSG
eukprot:scaffold68224_cov60-Phaeocystis_antarctica.AAC.1